MDHVADFLSGKVVKVHKNELDSFKNQAKKNKVKKRYRLCLHDTPENKLHEMLICRCLNDYSKPDKHVGTTESHTIIEGTEMIILFDDEGEVTDAFLLDKEEGYISYRINAEIYHMTVPLTKTVIDYEVKSGPFDNSTNIFPEWAPEEDDEDSVIKFMENIKKEAQKFIK